MPIFAYSKNLYGEDGEMVYITSMSDIICR